MKKLINGKRVAFVIGCVVVYKLAKKIIEVSEIWDVK